MKNFIAALYVRHFLIFEQVEITGDKGAVLAFNQWVAGSSPARLIFR
jgi:hypothetical protein